MSLNDKMQTKLKIIIAFLVISFVLNAQLQLGSILDDNMVLQQNSVINLWGKATPNQKITILSSWNVQIVSTIANDKGEWATKIKTTDAGGPYTILISTKTDKLLLKNILLGEVWLCSGQSNMEMPVEGFQDQPINGSAEIIANADYPTIRLFNVERAALSEPASTCKGSWKIANSESVAKFSAIGYLYAKYLTDKLKVPVGVICSSWGGSRIEAWMNKETIAKFPNALAQTTYEKTPEHQRATMLYNGMISPIKNFSIKGVLWYQGESNIINYYDYPSLMQAMVAQWRTDFNATDFPFYFVEIAPYTYPFPGSLNSALQREAQLKAVSLIPNSAMVSTIDLGDRDWIHPAEKNLIAKRLASTALTETYQIKGIQYKVPTFKSMEVKDSVMHVYFNNTPLGLSNFGKKVQCFELAGADKVFYPAKLKINKMYAQLWSDKVKIPIAVRYAFNNFPETEGYLYNTEGMPVPSFRTDNW